MRKSKTMRLPVDHQVTQGLGLRSPAEQCGQGAPQNRSSGSHHILPPTDGTSDGNTIWADLNNRMKQQELHIKRQKTHKQYADLLWRLCPFPFHGHWYPVGWVKQYHLSSIYQSKQKTKMKPQHHAICNANIDFWKWDNLTQNSWPIYSSQHESGSESSTRREEGHYSL